MKKFYESTKSKFLFLMITSLVISSSLFAAPVVRVQSVTGHAFVLENNRTRALQPGENLEDYSEIITEEGSQVVFTDYFDHRFYLSGSSHVKLLNRITELRMGYLWVQSYNESDSFAIQTANAKVDYMDGEAVVSFDQSTTRSQLLVVKGTFTLGNLLQDYMTAPVGEGQFSFIQNDYEKGSPRTATAIGEGSYQKVTSLFRDIKPMTAKDRALDFRMDDPAKRVAKDFIVKGSPISSRSIASVAPERKDGDIVYIQKAPAAAVRSAFTLESYHEKKIVEAENKLKKLKKMKKPFAPNYSKRSTAKVVIFGRPTIAPKRKPASSLIKVIQPQKEEAVKRAPASIVAKPEIQADKFESSLVEEYKKQLRHNEETNELIQELKNYDQDYKANY